jgi:FlaA1/EpsC-like NDP-sugar epimerase
VVFHAAAHKHVPLMEENPLEAIKNNVFGTINAVKSADKYGVSRFILISTDKAVNPANVMGATKRIAEMVIQANDRHSKTKFAAVRFGNVLGSNGSVIPLFKNQIEKGGPVTVTHPDITRFFMTIPEAVQLVIQAGSMTEGGEVFVLDMGQPVRIYDLAKNLIKLSGYKPNEDIEIVFTGLRAGEKLYEELLLKEELGLSTTKHDKIFVAKPIFTDLQMLKREISVLSRLLFENANDAVDYIPRIVPTYSRTK